jgi:hypothetical protein
MDITRTWGNIRENIKIAPKERLGYYELKKHKPWCDKECSELLYQRKQAKLQWLQDPSRINGNSLNKVRREASKHFRNKRREYLKGKINQLAMKSKNKDITDIYIGIKGFKRVYQLVSNLEKDENNNLLADSHILNRWKNYFSKLFNVHRVSEVRQIEIYTAEPLVSEPIPLMLKLLL